MPHTYLPAPGTRVRLHQTLVLAGCVGSVVSADWDTGVVVLLEGEGKGKVVVNYDRVIEERGGDKRGKRKGVVDGEDDKPAKTAKRAKTGKTAKTTKTTKS